MNHHRSSSSNDVAEDVEDGWGSDLEIEDDYDDTDIDNGDQNGDRGNDNNNNNNNDGTGTDTDYHAITPITTNRKVVSVESAELATTTATTGNNVDGVTVTNDGWGMDDDDIDLDDDDDDDYDDVEANDVEDSHNIHQQAATVAAVHPPNKYQQQQQHLYDDKMIPHRHMYSKLEYELHDYIVSIPQCRITQLKKILLEQYSTPEKAMELYQYYMKRPQLLQYTMDKELSRLDYTIVIGSNGVTHSYPKEVIMVQDKEEIRQILSSLQTNNNGPTIDDSTLLPLSICGRCANQSILVDILQAMSQPTPPHSDNSNDMILLPSKYMCSAVASHCHFTIDLIQSCVNVKAYFHISLPLLNQRWNIGQIRMTMNFHCPRSTNNNDPQQPLLPPSVDFHVEDYKSLVDVVDILDSNTDEAYAKHLQQCATIIRELSMMDDDGTIDNHHHQPPLQQLPVGSSVEGIMNFRDAYVNELLTTTDVVVDGMKSAWQDFDTATGLVSKFKQLPSLLPSVDPIVYDEEYETAMHHNTDTMMSFSQAQQQPVDSYYGSSYNNDTRPHPTHPPQQPQTSRPTSLLGGFVRSLAQSVTLPQEDPSIYQEWQQQHHHRQPQQPTLAPPTVVATTKMTSNIIPRLYNAETPSPSRHTIYNATSAIDHVKETIPRLYNISNDKASEQVVYNSEPQCISENSTAISSATAEHESPTKSDMHHLPTISNHLSQNISNIHKVTGPETIPKEQSQDGWDDDIDLTEMDDSCHDTAVDTSICVEMNETMARKGAIELLPSEHDADKVVPWVYDPITDIVPTRTRYRNPIGGYRDLRYM